MALEVVRCGVRTPADEPHVQAAGGCLVQHIQRRPSSVRHLHPDTAPSVAKTHRQESTHDPSLQCWLSIASKAAMSRLSLEFRRLFLAAEVAPIDEANQTTYMADSQGRLRALVLELARPAHWQTLAAVWKGVQAELHLPAPAIAVNGTDGMQLWFSLAEPLEATQAHAFLETLRRRYLADVSQRRLTLMPAAGATQDVAMARQVAPVPAAQGTTGHWSAFVAPDLAPLFDDTPWLDIPPGDDAQAGLLARLESIMPAQVDAALRQLQAMSATLAEATRAAAGDADRLKGAETHAAFDSDAKRFLLAVMNDATAPLALRVEAAKALLPYARGT